MQPGSKVIINCGVGWFVNRCAPMNNKEVADKIWHWQQERISTKRMSSEFRRQNEWFDNYSFLISQVTFIGFSSRAIRLTQKSRNTLGRLTG